MKSISLIILFFIFSLTCIAQPPRSYTSSEILLQLKKLNTVGSVLYIAAHPDDENTRLIAYLANEKCLRTGYLSLTRGDGGQNLIGPEQGVELGVIRTQELLAARRIDGGEQFFTRAYDFGYSKSPEETLQKWNKDSILGDMVWVIRNFRPDIIITRFATDGSGGHGHHTASAILAEEAFDAAADPNRFPEQLQYVSVWKTCRLFWNVSIRFQNPNADMSPYIKLDVGGYNPLLGKSYGEIAAESRSMHKSQGFGSARQRGEYFEYFKPIKGDTANLKDIFEGIDFSWKRVMEGERVNKQLSEIIKQFNILYPYEFTQKLSNIETLFLNMKDKNYSLYYYFDFCNYLKKHGNGFIEEYIAPTYYFSLTESAKMKHFMYRLKGNKNDDIGIECDYSTITPLYWLEKNIIDNRYQHPQIDLTNKFKLVPVSMPFHNPVTKKLNGYFPNAVQYKWTDPEKGELYRPVVITPPVMINVSDDVLVFNSDGKQKQLKLKLRAGKDNVKGQLSFKTNSRENLNSMDLNNSISSVSKLSMYEISPLTQNFELVKKGDEKELIFYVNAPFDAQSISIFFEAIVENQTYTKGIKEIKYDHIPVQTLFPEAEVKLVKLDVVKKSKRIGYIPGAGDEIQACLSQLGYEVTSLSDDKIASENLSNYDAIITGIRAYNTNQKLLSFKQILMDYVAAGGNLIVQYNTNSWAGPLSSDIGPHKFKITRNRITDEEAKVNFLLPNHPVLNTPNKITDKDFEGWMQERSIYHAGDWDSNYVAPLSMADPYEMTVGGVSPRGKPDNGALIIAKHGKGNFVYTGLVFFRQLPAGVPGAYRLMVNLIELGK